MADRTFPGDHASLLPGPPRPSPSAPGAAPRPQGPDWLLHACRVLNVCTALSAGLCAVAFAMALVVRFSAPIKDLNYYSGQAVRLYGILIAVLLIAVESEARQVLSLAPLLEIWLGRGTLQLFEAALTFREAYPRGETDFHRSLQLYRGVACAALTACAAIYIVGSLLCIEPLKRVRARREAALHHVDAELDSLERRRDVLRRQMGGAA